MSEDEHGTAVTDIELKPAKAVGNERRKLLATLLNNLAAALLLAGLLQPALNVLREQTSLSLDDYLASLAFIAIGITFHAAAQWLLGGLRD